MKEEKVNSIIYSHLHGKCSDDEQSQLNSWLSESEDNQTHFNQIAEIDRELKHVPIQLNPDTDSEWNAFLQNLSEQTSENPHSAKIVQMSSMRRFLRVAAMLVLTVGLGWFVKNQLAEETFAVAQVYEVPKGNMETITLSDGSMVYLNSDSKLSVYESFNAENRLLNLEGEAYFEVAKNKKLPFVIQTGNVTTEVTGTAFNLKSYGSDGQIQLTVTEGSVDFKTDRQLVSVVANVAATYTKSDNEISKADFDSEKALAWRSGRLVIENMTMTESLAALERRFDIEFINNTKVNSFRLIVQKDDSIESVLESLKTILSVDIQRDDSVITLSD